MKVLCMSSGGIYGFYTLGYLHKYLQENPIQFTHIVGSSIGAIIGFLFCIGYTSYEIYKLMINVKFKKIIKIDIFDIYKNFNSSRIELYSITNMKNIQKILTYFMKKKGINLNITYKELYDKTNIYLYVNALNIHNKKDTLFGTLISPDLQVLPTLLASSSIPGIFPPVKINNSYYIDGGIIKETPYNHLIKIIELNELNEKPEIYIQYYYNNVDKNVKNFIEYLVMIYSLFRYKSNKIKEDKIKNIFNKLNYDIIFFKIITNDKNTSFNFNITKKQIYKMFNYQKLFPNDN
jgi:NTE family protein